MEKQDKIESQVKPKPKKRKKKVTGGQKVIFFISKWLFILICLLFSVILGLVVGYSVIGDGETVEVFDLRTWKHVFDLVFKN
jgi:hypothetical protein